MVQGDLSGPVQLEGLKSRSEVPEKKKFCLWTAESAPARSSQPALFDSLSCKCWTCLTSPHAHKPIPCTKSLPMYLSWSCFSGRTLTAQPGRSHIPDGAACVYRGKQVREPMRLVLLSTVSSCEGRLCIMEITVTFSQGRCEDYVAKQV